MISLCPRPDGRFQPLFPDSSNQILSGAICASPRFHQGTQELALLVDTFLLTAKIYDID